ncbi:hypothetical protein D3C81_2303260 [compost metagenome]
MDALQLRLTEAGEDRDMLGGELHQVVALQRIFRSPHHVLGHVPQQLFPQMQVAGSRWYGDQFAVGPP